MAPKNLGELLRITSHRHPQRTAIVFGSKKISYKALNEATDHIAAGLIHLGIKEQTIFPEIDYNKIDKLRSEVREGVIVASGKNEKKVFMFFFLYLGW